MGLNTTHDAWQGPYSLFHEWRTVVARAAGYKIDGDMWALDAELPYGAIDGEWEKTPSDPLVVLLAHSGCDGEIRPAQAGALADRMEELLPSIEKADNLEDLGPDDYGVFATRRFIDGLRRAVEEGEPVLFG